MRLDGKICRLECTRGYGVPKTCVIKDTCVYNGGLLGPLGSTIPTFAPKNDFNSCKPEEIKMQRITVRPLVQESEESDLTVNIPFFPFFKKKFY